MLFGENSVASKVAEGLSGVLIQSAFANPEVVQGPAVRSSLPTSKPQLRKAAYLGKFRVTFYWLVEEESYAGRRSSPLYTEDGKPLGSYTSQFVKDFRTESCALLQDGRIISYLKRSNRCTVVDAPIGINGFTLTELKSIAVDPSIIPVGSTVYIPEAADVPIGSNCFHDGIFKAHDVGSAIKGERIDVYLGLKANMDYFRSTALCNSGYVSVYLLQ
jgi:3D (Asp-Asp-Asp) domain-containing protein